MKPFGSFLVGGMTREEFLGEPDLIEFPQPKRPVSKDRLRASVAAELNGHANGGAQHECSRLKPTTTARRRSGYRLS